MSRRADKLLRRLGLRKGHKDPVPSSTFRLCRLIDRPWPEYVGGRAWCDAVLRPCQVCGGRCCDCYHHERRSDDEGQP